jgi:acylphosphatase
MVEWEAVETIGGALRTAPPTLRRCIRLSTSAATSIVRLGDYSKKSLLPEVLFGFMPLSGPAEWRISYRVSASCGRLARKSSVNRARMQVLYSGRVQGVGFRYTVKATAAGFDVTGTVRNLPDGRVELIAEGAKDELNDFCEGIRQSGLDHFIKKEDINWGEATNEFRGFEIVR